jgi:hypothetical protein
MGQAVWPFDGYTRSFDVGARGFRMIVPWPCATTGHSNGNGLSINGWRVCLYEQKGDRQYEIEARDRIEAADWIPCSVQLSWRPSNHRQALYGTSFRLYSSLCCSLYGVRSLYTITLLLVVPSSLVYRIARQRRLVVLAIADHL